MSGYTIFKDKQLKLVGTPLKVGDTLPDVTVISTAMQPVEIAQWRSSASIIFTVPSLDTPVCSIETKRFNEELQSLDFEGNVAVISCDLPFAMQRWCGAEQVSAITPLSDYRFRSFGESTGTLIEEWQLLSRAVFISDDLGKLRYVEYVQTLSSEPDYASALRFLKENS